MTTVSLVVNGQHVSAEVSPRTRLVDFLRDHLRLTGTHIGCDTSQCGACVVHLDGKSVKACSILAVQAAGRTVLTIEGVAGNGPLHPLQQAFHEHHALQCGFCTPGMVMSALDLLMRKPDPDEETIRSWLEGNFCRCTGYRPIVDAVRAAAAALRGSVLPTESGA
jgi:carbon-monoxide dehydrogenase small subunit